MANETPQVPLSWKTKLGGALGILTAISGGAIHFIDPSNPNGLQPIVALGILAFSLQGLGLGHKFDKYINFIKEIATKVTTK